MTEFIVLGAGMAGVGAALALQARGHAVSLLDRRAPGSETSHGNAGVIQSEAVEPYAIPRDVPTLLRYALGRSNDVVWHARDLPRLAPALWRYFQQSAPARHGEISRSYAQLIGRVLDDHAPLITASESEPLIRRTGMGEIHRSARALEAAAREARRLREAYGIPSQVMDASAMREDDPALRSGPAGMLLWTGSWSCTDPGALTRAYADLFARRGGRVLTGEAQSLARRASGWQVASDDGPVEASQVVVALGPWGPDLLRRFGYRVPMVWKRGYHGHYDTPARLARPYVDADNGVVMSSMTRGLRITTGAELVRRDGPAAPRQLERGRRAVAELVELGEPVPDGQWHGHRPCLPDMLPLVGPAPRHEGLWFDFGHGHQGFTLGPTTGEILAEAIEGRDDALTAALDPRRRGL
ncbi:NAD(P)/FAD-dependent oxidoreductase [Salipiger mucosus]|uniref:D-amino acid dehydrogenase small subunit n=1 Tax=Salipiger mucosus DSM 16094 TaxID=1123237 RepID=S9QGS8_9RHOB|nr:FAD-dependent oxidoreductase [Salipiger mucosus]EPX78823.1 D-amino acid dehydrogenase small subunit [Salipiger mucosus DSM 16094]